MKLKFRTIEYIKKRKARAKMQHPGDLASFLKAEMDLCNSGVVKKHIRKTLEQLEEGMNRPDAIPEA